MKDFTKLGVGDYWRILRKRRWYFVAAAILGWAAAGIYIRFGPQEYRSETRIMVEGGSLLDDSISPTAGQVRAEERIELLKEQIRSRSFLERIIEEFRLNTPVPGEVFSMENAVNLLRGRIDVTKTSGNTFTLSYGDREPQTARAITKRLADMLIQSNQSSQAVRAQSKDQFLEEQLSRAELELANHDQKLKEFKRAHLGELPEQSTANMNAMSSLNAQLVAVESGVDRARDQQRLLEFKLAEQKRLEVLSSAMRPTDTAKGPEPGGPPGSTPLKIQLVAKQAQLAENIAKYTDKHPDVQRLAREVEELKAKVSQEQDRIATQTPALTPLGQATAAGAGASETSTASADSGFAADIAQINFELANIRDSIAKREKDRELILKQLRIYQERLNLAPALEQELLALEREHATLKQNVDTLQARKFNAQITASAVANTKNESYRIIDEAYLPEIPAGPSRPILIGIGFGFGIALGLAAVLGREVFDTSIGSEAEAASILKFPVLVSIPELDHTQANRNAGKLKAG